jgi:hypothetical protein
MDHTDARDVFVLPSLIQQIDPAPIHPSQRNNGDNGHILPFNDLNDLEACRAYKFWSEWILPPRLLQPNAL